jgi:hypothetical protein
VHKQKTLRHFPVAGQEETEQPGVVFYHILEMQACIHVRDWQPLVDVMQCNGTLPS